MGIGTCEPLSTASEWNAGSCDVMAVALHRIYGFPLMAEFEQGVDNGAEALGYLIHAWVRLPDGRALDADGPKPMFEPIEGGDPDDPWVVGYKIVEISDADPHLLDVREETDYVDSIRQMQAPQWIRKHLASALADLGYHPVRSDDEIELLAHPDLEAAVTPCM